MEMPRPGPGLTELPPGERLTRRVVACLAAGLFVGGCVTPAVANPGESLTFRYYAGYHLGYQALLLGCLSSCAPAWFANPLLLVGGILFRARAYGGAAGFGGAAFLVGLTVRLYRRDGAVIYADRAVTDLYVGYYLWQASMLALAGGAVVLKLYRWRGGERPTQGWAADGDEYAAPWSGRSRDTAGIRPDTPEIRGGLRDEDDRTSEGITGHRGPPPPEP